MRNNFKKIQHEIIAIQFDSIKKGRGFHRDNRGGAGRGKIGRTREKTHEKKMRAAINRISMNTVRAPAAARV